MVPGDEFARANALHAAINQGAVVVGPALGALVLVATTPALAILLNGVTFIASAVALLSAGRRRSFRPPTHHR